MHFLNSLRIGTLALASLSVPVFAAPVVFNYSGAMQSFTAAVAGTYVVTAVGAQGGAGSSGFAGGRGASITGSFDLAAGDSFWLAVGGIGQSTLGSGGGGGGSFFVSAGGTPLLIAGGGGGIRAAAAQNGCDASLTAYATRGSTSSPTSSCSIKSDDLGLGGDMLGGSWGSGGGGFYGDGADDASYGNGGGSWANGVYGGSATTTCYATAGGFGGGGSGSGCYGGGGGGGYSGGDGGFIAGGGGSWNAGYDKLALSGVGYGNGLISIDFAAGTVPEPQSLALLLVALLAAGVATKRRRG